MRLPRKRKKRKTSGKLLKRTRKEWEASINDHIGKFIDKLTFSDLQAMAVGALAAYTFRDPRHFLTGSLAVKLALAPSITTSTAGLAVLAGLAVTGLPRMEEGKKPIDDAFYGFWVKPAPEDVPVPPGHVLKYCPLDGKWYARLPNQSACPPIFSFP